MSGETKKKCFVVSPIGDDSTPERAKQKKHANTVLKSFIRPALKGLVDDVVRSDEISEPGDINRQVLDRLVNDDLIVADLSFHNPNVFYELAIRHMLGKPYVQMIQKGERIPFDIGQKRTIFFDPTDLDALEDTRDLIRKQAEACLEPGFKVETPLGSAVTVDSLRSDDPVQRSLSLILEKLDRLEGGSPRVAVVDGGLSLSSYFDALNSGPLGGRAFAEASASPGMTAVQWHRVREWAKVRAQEVAETLYSRQLTEPELEHVLLATRRIFKRQGGDVKEVGMLLVTELVKLLGKPAGSG